MIAVDINIMMRTLMMGKDVPGWATLAVATAFLGGIQLLSIGMLDANVARIFTEVKQRPNQLVAELHGFPGGTDGQRLMMNRAGRRMD